MNKVTLIAFIPILFSYLLVKSTGIDDSKHNVLITEGSSIEVVDKSKNFLNQNNNINLEESIMTNKDNNSKNPPPPPPPPPERLVKEDKRNNVPEKNKG